MAYVGTRNRVNIFRHLAKFTVLAPPLYVMMHSRPVATLPDQASCSFYTLMSMFIMQLLQYLVLKGRRKNQLQILFSIRVAHNDKAPHLSPQFDPTVELRSKPPWLYGDVLLHQGLAFWTRMSGTC